MYVKVPLILYPCVQHGGSLLGNRPSFHRHPAGVGPRLSMLPDPKAQFSPKFTVCPEIHWYWEANCINKWSIHHFNHEIIVELMQHKGLLKPLFTSFFWVMGLFGLGLGGF